MALAECSQSNFLWDSDAGPVRFVKAWSMLACHVVFSSGLTILQRLRPRDASCAAPVRYSMAWATMWFVFC